MTWEEEDPQPTRFRTPAELLAVYQAHEKFLNRKIQAPSQEEIDLAIEKCKLWKEWKEMDPLIEKWI